MTTTVEVMGLKGMVFCPKCSTRIEYDFNGRPPMSNALATCQCGFRFHIRRLPLTASLGPREVK